MPGPKDSIFVSIIKRFTGSFASVFGFLIALFLFLAAIGLITKQTTKSLGFILPMTVHVNKAREHLPLASTSPLILRINIDGVIGPKESFNTSAALKQIFQQPALYGIDKDRVKGILLHINSPGGAAIETDVMYDDLMEFKKEHNIPIHVWIGDVCASGGYYLACVGDHISSQRLTMIGSVGVLFGPHFNFYQLMQKIGVDQTTLTAGKNKISFPMYTPLDPKGVSYQDWTNITEGIYSRFLDVVTDARAGAGLTRTNLKNYGAKVYGSADAKKLGYIDEANVRYMDAQENFAKSLGIDDKGYQTISFYRSMSFPHMMQAKLSSISSYLSGDDNHKELFSLKADFVR